MKSTNTNTKLHMTSEMNKGYLNYMNTETFTSTLERVNQLELELSTLKDQLKTHDEYSNCGNTLLFLGIEENAYFTAEEAVRNIMKTSTTPSCGGPLRAQKSPVASFPMPAPSPQIWSKMKIS